MKFKRFDLNKIPLSGHNLIEASAGTGKTYTISRLFLRLLLEKELPLSSILVVTFTEAATQELKERVYLLLKEAVNVFLQKNSTDPFFLSLLSDVDNKKGIELLSSAIHNFDTVSIYTIHGFCQRVLFEHSFESGVSYNSSVISDQSIVIKEITNDFWRLNFYEASAQFASYTLHTGLTHERFSDLLKLSGRISINLRIIPYIKDINYLNSESVFNQKLEAVKKLWFSEKDIICSLLYSKSLKAVKYKNQIVQEMISNMDLLSVSTIADPLLFNKFENFTSSVLQANTKKNCITPSHPFFDRCEDLQKSALQLKENYDNCIINLKIKYIDYVCRELKIRKDKKNQLYFDDLLLRVYDTLVKNPQNCKLKQVLGKVYKAALIDEFQDTDSIQYKIFSTLFSNSIMFLIGDPKQSIYSFRGADIFTYLEASKRVSSKYTLYTNYRCSKRLLEAINVLFSEHEKMFVFDGISFLRSQAADLICNQSVKIKDISEKPFKFIFIDNDEQKQNIKEIRLYICSVITSYVLNLIGNVNNSLNEGIDRLNPQDIAILVRTNSEAEMVKNTLSEAGVHSVIDSGCSVFESNEAINFMRLLQAVSDPCNDDAVRCALTTDIFSYNANRIESMFCNKNESEEISELFFNLHDLWTESGFQVMIRFLFNNLKIRSKMLSLPQGERKLTNYLHLSELIHVEEQRSNAGMTALLNWVIDKIYDDSVHVPDEEVMRLESDEDAVKIVTIHKSKGLEYPVVFCPFCWHRSDIANRKNEPIIFHNEDGDIDPVLALGSNEIENNRNLAEKEILAENMRLLYVALTRAKLGCYVVYGKLPNSESSSLSYLLFGGELENISVQNLKNHVKPLSSEQIFRRLQSIEHKCDSISVNKIIDNNNITNSIYKKCFTPKMLLYRKFKGAIADSWRISSFSSLTRSHHYSEIPDYDFYVYPDNKNEKTDFENIMDFPKGSVAGTFLHHIFEKIKFSDVSLTAPDIISESLLLYGFDTKWFNTILKLVKDVTETDFDKESKLRMSRLSQSSCLKEVQFNFPLKQFSVDDLNKIISFNSQLDLFEADYSISELEFSVTKGYMKGFIDLIFEWNNRFFLLDWKSNFLGSSKDDYSEKNLFNVMKKEHYILQSYIYLIAMDKFLRLRYPSYSYDKNFGGVFYIFLRGINPGSRSGIYFYRPEKDLLSQLRQIISD